jgi:hypothetical protein
MNLRREPGKVLNRVEVIPAAREQAPVIANLLELYAHDFSEFHPIELGADGKFGYRELPLRICFRIVQDVPSIFWE